VAAATGGCPLTARIGGPLFWARRLLTWGGLLLGLALLPAVWGAFFWLYDAPDVAALKTANPTNTRFMDIRRAQAEKDGRPYSPRQTWVGLDAVSPHLIHAVLTSEDKKFYQHKGFDFESMDQAFRLNLSRRRIVRGGSTITQQVAKNLYLSPRKTYFRKFKEMLITQKLERTLEKKRIFEIYLNIVEWGDGIFGAEAASQAYFKKSAKDLTIEEAASLAAVIPSPIRHSPLGQGRFVSRRKAWVMKQLELAGYIPPPPPAVVETPVPIEDPGLPELVPLEMAPAPPAVSAGEPDRPLPEDAPPLSAAARVLIAADQRPFAEYLSRLIGLNGFHTYLAATSEETLRKARSLQPQVVLLDTDLSGEKGIETCRALKRGGGNTAVIVLYSPTQPGDANRAQAAGADGVMAKPVYSEQLVGLLQQLVGQ